mgnify:CR=1 FL=1
MEIHEIIRQLREDADLTQSQVAEKLGTTRQYYNKYENGLHPISTEVLKKLCILYGVSADYILGLPKNLTWPE